MKAIEQKLNNVNEKLEELSELECDTPMQKLTRLESLRDELSTIVESSALQQNTNEAKALTTKLESTIQEMDKLQGKILQDTKNQIRVHRSNPPSPHLNSIRRSDTIDLEAGIDITKTTPKKKKSFLSKGIDIASKFRERSARRYSNQMVIDLQQKLLDDNVHVEDSKIIKERSKKLEMLEQQLIGIQDLYVQVSDKVLSQGEQLDSIENNVSTSVNYSRVANEEFNITIDRNRWSSKTIIALLFIVFFCLIIIYFTILR